MTDPVPPPQRPILDAAGLDQLTAGMLRRYTWLGPGAEARALAQMAAAALRQAAGCTCRTARFGNPDDPGPVTAEDVTCPIHRDAPAGRDWGACPLCGTPAGFQWTR